MFRNENLDRTWTDIHLHWNLTFLWTETWHLHRMWIQKKLWKRDIIVIPIEMTPKPGGNLLIQPTTCSPKETITFRPGKRNLIDQFMFLGIYFRHFVDPFFFTSGDQSTSGWIPKKL